MEPCARQQSALEGMRGQRTWVAEQGEEEEANCVDAHHTLPWLLIAPLWDFCRMVLIYNDLK